MQDSQIFTAREVQKADARPGGYIATGGHGGITGTVGQPPAELEAPRGVLPGPYSSGSNAAGERPHLREYAWP
jgi:hypothetical protein